MIGKVLATTLSLFMFSYFIYTGIAFYMYTCSNERVNDICYDVAETVSTKGSFSRETLLYLQESLSKYGDYNIQLCLITYTEDKKVSYRNMENILDKNLNTGDRIYIAVYAENTNMFEKLTGASIRPEAFKIAAIT